MEDQVWGQNVLGSPHLKGSCFLVGQEESLFLGWVGVPPRLRAGEQISSSSLQRVTLLGGHGENLRVGNVKAPAALTPLVCSVS